MIQLLKQLEKVSNGNVKTKIHDYLLDHERNNSLVRLTATKTIDPSTLFPPYPFALPPPPQSKSRAQLHTRSGTIELILKEKNNNKKLRQLMKKVNI